MRTMTLQLNLIWSNSSRKWKRVPSQALISKRSINSSNAWKLRKWVTSALMKTTWFQSRKTMTHQTPRTIITTLLTKRQVSKSKEKSPILWMCASNATIRRRRPPCTPPARSTTGCQRRRQINPNNFNLTTKRAIVKVSKSVNKELKVSQHPQWNSSSLKSSLAKPELSQSHTIQWWKLKTMTELIHNKSSSD